MLATHQRDSFAENKYIRKAAVVSNTVDTNKIRTTHIAASKADCLFVSGSYRKHLR